MSLSFKDMQALVDEIRTAIQGKKTAKRSRIPYAQMGAHL